MSITPDYGLKDHFVGALKGKILSEYSEAVIDISHEIDPFNTVEAHYIIGASYSSFPKGTVHLIELIWNQKENNILSCNGTIIIL
jgi:S-adenosylmethionine hydrolase